MKKFGKIISVFLSGLMILSIFSTNVFAVNVERKNSSLGFFESVGASAATDALTTSIIADKTDITKYGDATNLNLMFKFLDMIDDCNQIRASEGLDALKVTDTLMAYAQADANWSGAEYDEEGIADHARVFNCGENLAWGYGTEDYDGDRDVVTYNNPFEGWYDEERQLYLKHSQALEKGEESPIKGDVNEACGHYFNIIRASYVTTGFAYNKNTRCFSQTFSNRVSGTAYTTDEYRQRLTEYAKSIGYDKQMTCQHKDINWTTIKESTCYEYGVAEGYCNVCGAYTGEDSIPRKNHKFILVVTKEATCTENGTEKYMCSVCGDSFGEHTTTKAHSYAWKTVKEPTCLEEGTQQLYCTVCKQEFEDTVSVPKANHTPGEWEVKKAPTCTQSGEKTQYCSVCHEPVNYGLVDPVPHTMSTRVITEPTCTQHGIEELYCTVCKQVISRNVTDGYAPHQCEWVTFREASCTQEGLRVYRCKVCGSEIGQNITKKTEHVPSEWITVQPATKQEPGLKVQRCTVCNQDINTQKIPVLSAYRYPDVHEDDWYYNAVTKASELGYFKGYQDGSFGPGKNIIRQDFAVVMSKIAGVNLSEQSTDILNFPDVNKNDYYAKNLAWCVENKIISGYGDGRFGPADAITREQICVMIYKFMTNVKSKEDISENDVNTVLAKFSDQNNISDWARHAVAWCVQNKVISGAQGGKFVNPVSNANRAEIAQMLYSMQMNNLI